MINQKKLIRLKRYAERNADKIKSSLFFDNRNFVSDNGLTKSDIEERIDRLRSCSTIVELKSGFVENTDGTLEQKMTVSAANYCRQHVLCPLCADRLQAKRRAKYELPLREQADLVSLNHSRYCYFVTKTIADGENLSERLEHLKKSMISFRKKGQKRNNGEKRSFGESSKIRAAIATIEIKRGSGSGLWHVHSHELVFTDSPLDYHVYDKDSLQKLRKKYGKNIPEEILSEISNDTVLIGGKKIALSKMSREWMESTGDSVGIDVRPIRHVPKNATGKKKRMFKKMSFSDSILYQSKEVLKYPIKPDAFNSSDAIAMIDGTYNKRLVSTYGEFRKIGGDDYNDDPDPSDETWVVTWDSESCKYSNPIPARLRDIIDDEEEKSVISTTRSDCGRITGQYRRQRRRLLSMALVLGDTLSVALDAAKRTYREKICARWSIHRQAIATKNRILEGCDKYSPVLALAGTWIPGSDSREVYATVF